MLKNNVMTKDELFKIIQDHTEDDYHAECILAAVDTLPDVIMKYITSSFDESALIHGTVKRISQYGGSLFVTFSDNKCYRLQWQSYNNNTVTLD